MRKRMIAVLTILVLFEACSSTQALTGVQSAPAPSKQSAKESVENVKVYRTQMDKQIMVLEQRIDQLNLEDRALILGAKDIIATANPEALANLLKVISDGGFTVSDIEQKAFWSTVVMLSVAYMAHDGCLDRANLKSNVFQSLEFPEARRIFLLADYYLSTRLYKEYRCIENQKPKKPFIPGPKKDNSKEKYVSRS